MTSVTIDRAAGLSSATAIKGPCRVATTGNITLSGEQTIDGVSVVDGDRVLVQFQTEATENGIYVASANEWSRAKDFNRNGDVKKGTLVTVGAGNIHAVATEDPIVFGTSNITIIKPMVKYNVLNYDVSPEGDSATNTPGIQEAIDAAYANDGGIVTIPTRGAGVYAVEESTATTLLGYISAGPVFSTAVASSLVSLILRDGVYLEFEDGATVENQNPAVSILGLFKMQRGGVLNGYLKSIWSVDDQVGAGHGIISYCETSATDDPNFNIQLEKLRISNVASYGIGMQFGFMKNNRYRDLWVHDTGADAFDHKARPHSDGSIPVGNRLDGLLAERYGRRTGTSNTCAIDIRGPLLAENIVAREVGYSTHGNTGIRLSAGLYQSSLDIRQPSAEAVVSGFQIDGGDPTLTGGYGVTLLDSGGIVANGFVKNMDTGVTAQNSSSGWGTNNGGQIHNVVVEGARTKSFDIVSDRVSVTNCFASGQVERFEEDQGNLAASQTVFTSPRAFDGAAVKVYKNGTLLTLTTDYTVGGSTTITLTSGALISDVIEIVSPTPIGFYYSGSFCAHKGNRTQYVTTARSNGGSAGTTLLENGNLHEDEAWYADYATSSTITREAKGSGADIEQNYLAKGASGITLRSRSQRAFRAVNAVDSCVNWVEARGSTTGNKVQVLAQGSDTNIPWEAAPKGSAQFMVPIGNVPTYANDAAAAAGGVPVGGFYRNGSALQIRVT